MKIQRFGSFRFALVLTAFLVLMPSRFVTTPSYAQVTGATLTGTVKDASGSVVPNTKISIENASTGVVRVVTSNTDGLYSAPNLLPGNYVVTATADGFSTEVRSGITLTVGGQQELNLILQVGQISQKIEVTGEAPTVELVSATIGAVVESTTVTELPLNGRDWTQLATLQPGVNSVSGQQLAVSSGGSGRIVRGNGNEVAISGTRPQQNNYRIDGISINDYSNNAPGSVLGFTAGVDAIDEFTVLTNNYSAQYGKTSGGVIEAITKSGTNQLHGTAYEFLRNSALDARNYFDPPKIPEFRRNQFGASLGGPIQKDKTFFFADYEGFRQTQDVTQLDTVPSATARAGTIFSTNPDGSIKTTTVGVNPAIAPFLPFWPTANGALIAPGNTALYSIVQRQTAPDNFADARVDHKFSEKDSASATYQYDSSNLTLPDPLDNVLLVNLASRQLVALEENHIFSSRLVNSARFGFARVFASGGSNTTALNPLAKNTDLASVPGANADSFTVPGLTNFGGGVGNGQYTAHHFNSFQGSDDAFFTKGIHSFKFGVNVERDQDNVNLQTLGGMVTFGSLTNFLLDQPSSYRGNLPGVPFTPSHYRETIFGTYFQDDIHLLSNLTLNAGLRYEMSTVPTEATADKLPHLATPTSATYELGNLWSNPTLRNFEPRVGFAWDPFRNGKSSIRGGFGMFDVLPLAYAFISNMPQSAPFYLQGRTSSVPLGVYPSGALGLLKPSSLRDMYIQTDPKRNYVMQWNLSVQRELMPNLTVTAAYVGSRGVHMALRMNDGDIVLPTLTPAGYLWPASGGVKINPNFGRTDLVTWGNDSFYHALQLGMVKRMSHGFQLQGSYSWGRSIDSGSATLINDTLSNGIDTFFFDPRLNRGPSDFDISQNVTVSYTWLIPSPKSLHGPAAWAARGWELGGIFTARTGSPFTPVIAPDPLGEGNSSAQDFPDRVPGCKLVNPGSVTAYLNLSCFTVPMATPAIAAQCTPFSAVPGSCANLLGNAGRNEVFGPGEAEFDFSVFKNTYIRENFNLQFRMEAFNVFNHPNFDSPLDNSTVIDVTGAPVGGAGLIDATSTTNRQIQFGLKLIW